MQLHASVYDLNYRHPHRYILYKSDGCETKKKQTKVFLIFT